MHEPSLKLVARSKTVLKLWNCCSTVLKLANTKSIQSLNSWNRSWDTYTLLRTLPPPCQCTQLIAGNRCEAVVFVRSAPQDPDFVTHRLPLPPDHLVKQKLSPPGQWRWPDDRRQVQHVNAPGTAEERKGSQPHPPMGATIRRLDEVVAPMYGCSNGNDNDEEIESIVYTVHLQNLSCCSRCKSSVRSMLLFVKSAAVLAKVQL